MVSLLRCDPTAIRRPILVLSREKNVCLASSVRHELTARVRSTIALRHCESVYIDIRELKQAAMVRHGVMNRINDSRNRRPERVISSPCLVTAEAGDVSSREFLVVISNQERDRASTFSTRNMNALSLNSDAIIFEGSIRISIRPSPSVSSITSRSCLYSDTRSCIGDPL
jgi:hypothetical protein